MSTWALLQVVFNIFIGLGLFIVIMRLSRAPKDDPRLSRGLQVLQSKISILEDLSDRTDVQVNQLTSLLDQKGREVQSKIQAADQQINGIHVAMERSMEVAKIFQDKIPHQEIIERQNTMKYVQAARLAHQGMSLSEISEKVDLPHGEIEFISKVNREQLMFHEDQLPQWAKDEVAPSAKSDANVTLHSLGEKFRQATVAPESVFVTPSAQAPASAAIKENVHEQAPVATSLHAQVRAPAAVPGGRPQEAPSEGSDGLKPAANSGSPLVQANQAKTPTNQAPQSLQKNVVRRVEFPRITSRTLE